MDEDLKFCLLKFAEEQQLLHDEKRKEQEQIYQNYLNEIRNKEMKILQEQQMITELFEKQLMANKQKLDDSKNQLEYEIKQQLQENIQSKEEIVKQTIHAQEKEIELWIQEKQQERSHISDKNNLLEFDKAFETEKKSKMNQLDELRQLKFKELQIERESLYSNAEELLKMLANTDNKSSWLTVFQKWCDEKLQPEKSKEKLSSDSIKRISSSILDINANKQELIADFKQKMEKIFIDEEIEFNKHTDEQIQQINDQKGLALNTLPSTTTALKSPSSGILSFLRRTLPYVAPGVFNADPTETEASATSVQPKRQEMEIANKSASIRSLEEAKRQHSEQLKKERAAIISELESSNIDSISDKIRQWLKMQSDERRRWFEQYQQECKENEAQHLADDQAQTIELVCALNQLAINSKSADEFKKKLKHEEDLLTEKHLDLKSSKMTTAIPVIVLQVDDPKVHKLAICIRFNEDFDQWMKNADSNKHYLISFIQKQFNLPENAFEIISIEKGSIVVHARIHPPHGQHVFQQLMAGRITEIGGYDTISITLGELSLGIEQEKMNARYNRNYGNHAGGTHWNEALDRGGKPYFCPKGWRRFGIKVANTKEEFDRRWGQWHIAYHGTANTNASAILGTGLKVGSGCYTNDLVVYVSPSINYSAHYRYAKPWKNPEKPGKYYQMIFQCRINPRVVTPERIRPQTLRCPQNTRIDEHFTNNEVEWIIHPTNNSDQYINDNIICYGIMIRVCDEDPFNLPESQWWQHTPYRRNYL